MSRSDRQARRRGPPRGEQARETAPSAADRDGVGGGEGCGRPEEDHRRPRKADPARTDGPSRRRRGSSGGGSAGRGDGGGGAAVPPADAPDPGVPVRRARGDSIDIQNGPSSSLDPPARRGGRGRRLQDGMATALSLDHWSAPPSSRCDCEDSPDLSVNFLCMHPRPSADGGEASDSDGGVGSGPPPPPPRSPPTPTPTPPSPPKKRTAARFQEIFVDLCVLHAASFDAASRHVLDERFDSFLGVGERSFKLAVLELVRGDALPPEARDTSAYRRLERMLRSEMGLDGLDADRERTVRQMRGLRRASSCASGGEGGDDESSEGLGGEASASTNSACSSVCASDASGGSGGQLDPTTARLREVISQIRSDDGLFRRCALLQSNRDDPAPSAEEVTAILSALPKPQPRPAVYMDECHIDPSELAKRALDMHPPPELRRECDAFRSLLRPPGHVFVANASVCDIYCDAFLCPCGIGKKDAITGSVYSRWFRNMREGNPRLLRHLRGGGNSGGDESGSGSGSGRGGDQSPPIPMKRYAAHDRVATPRHWPWEEFRRKDEDAQLCGLMGTAPLFVAGEVSIEKSSLDGTRGNRRWRRGVDAPSEQDHLTALMETVRQFVSASLEELRAEQLKPRANRERYLLALPVVGTGGGRAGDLTGQIVEKMLGLLCEAVSRNDDLDCVLVCADVATFSHAQNCRRDMCDVLDGSGGHWRPHRGGAAAADRRPGRGLGDVEPFPSFRLLSPRMREDAQQLAKLAERGHLSMFIGAGVSMGSGLPGWYDLLLGVEDQFTPNGLPSERMLAGGADPLAVADWLGILAASRPDRYGRRRDLKERIAALIEERSQNPSLLMSLLTSLPCKSIVTQNYDRLIERAFECRNVAERRGGDAADAGARDDAPSEALSVIPHSPVRGADRWLLKMHGCVSSHESIVITSDDYRNYESGRRKALAGLVQANLMTTHLLFVGFSLSDPNYLRIIEEVRHALKPGQHPLDVDSASDAEASR